MSSLDRLRPTSSNDHFWQGKPGLWRLLLPAERAYQIRDVHRKNFDAFKYRCDPDETLTEQQAEENWQKLI